MYKKLIIYAVRHIRRLIRPAPMPIVSVSLNSEILAELDRLQSALGFSGRSEAIRAGIRSFVSEERQKADLSGDIHAILLVVHGDEFDHAVAGIKHNFEDLISTHLHSKIDERKCMELFVMDGDAARVATMTRDFQVNRNMDTVRLVAL